MGLVGADDAGRITEIVIKPRDPTPLRQTWCLAVWTPAFGRFMHDRLAPAWHSEAARRQRLAGAAHAEIYVGDVFNAALADGFRLDAVTLSREPSRDAGTPEALAWAQRVAPTP